jgi:hypothetical protein
MKELIQKSIDALEYHTAQTRPINRTDDVIAELKAALSAVPAMKEHEFNQMQQAFEESKFHQCGESQADRIANWNVWKESWKAALSAVQENHIPKVGKMVQQPAQEPVKEATE